MPNKGKFQDLLESDVFMGRDIERDIERNIKRDIERNVEIDVES